MKHAVVSIFLALVVGSISAHASDDVPAISRELATCAGVFSANGDVIEGWGKPSAAKILRGRGLVFYNASYLLKLDDALETNKKLLPVKLEDEVKLSSGYGYEKALTYLEMEDYESFKVQLADCTALGETHASILDAALAGTEHDDQYDEPVLWNGPRRSFSARLRSIPEETQVAIGSEQGHSYQSTYSFESGAALYSIVILPISASVSATSNRDFIEAAHVSFVESLNADPTNGSTKWRAFEKDVKRMYYEIMYTANGEEISSYGYWFVYRNSVYRVSVSYNADVSYADKRLIRRFPNTFHLGG